MTAPASAVDVLARLVSVPSVSGSEHRAARLLVGEMRDLGFDARLDEVGNAIGERSGGPGPVVMVLGHIDTVPGWIPVRVRDGALFGRGTVDAKGPLVAAMFAAAAVRSPAGRLIVVGAVGEEVAGSPGARHLLDRFAPDTVLVAEPSGTDGVTIGYKGRIEIDCRFLARPRHPSHPEPNAVELGFGYWQAVSALLPDRVNTGLFGRLTGRLETMFGLAEEAGLRASFRIPPGFDIDAFVTKLATMGPGSVQVLERTPAVVMDRSSLVVRALTIAVRGQGLVPRTLVKTGTSDMNVVVERWAVPMAAYGPGDSLLDHSDDEHIEIADFLRAIEILTEALGSIGPMWLREREEDERLPDREVDGPSGDREVVFSAEELQVAERLRSLGYVE
jgi:[amino group carrier protein]-lysine/ornithine hydrolase